MKLYRSDTMIWCKFQRDKQNPMLNIDVATNEYQSIQQRNNFTKICLHSIFQLLHQHNYKERK